MQRASTDPNSISAVSEPEKIRILFQLCLEEPTDEDAESLSRFSSNFAHYYLHKKEMFYDFTIRTRDGGAVPANKATTELYAVLGARDFF